MEDFEAWLTGDDVGGSATRVVRPPGWSVAVPDGWQATVFRGTLPEPYASWAAAGKVLAVQLGNRVAAWPLRAAAGGFTPIPGIEPLLRAADGLRPELVVVSRKLSSSTGARTPTPNLKRIPRAAAVQAAATGGRCDEVGLITEDERQRLLADARLATSVAMEQVIESVAEDEPELRAELQADARTNRRGFGAWLARLVRGSLLRPRCGPGRVGLWSRSLPLVRPEKSCFGSPCGR